MKHTLNVLDWNLTVEMIRDLTGLTEKQIGKITGEFLKDCEATIENGMVTNLGFENFENIEQMQREESKLQKAWKKQIAHLIKKHGNEKGIMTALKILAD